MNCANAVPRCAQAIYGSNRLALLSWRNLPGRWLCGSLVGDSLEETTAALTAALSGADVVITCGGVSVGEADFVKEAFHRAGGEIELWRVAIKPGKPFVFGRCGRKYLFGLPGNPVSALVTFALLVRPALLRWQGAARTELPEQPGRLEESLANRGDRIRPRHPVGDGLVRSAGVAGVHALRSLTAANGLVAVRREDPRSGRRVQVLCLDR
jgi:molybdopterin molybdotransferase